MPSPKYLSVIPVIVTLLLISSTGAFAQDEPWRIRDALGLPEGLALSGSHRMLFENLDEQFRAGRDGGDQTLFFQTLLRASLNLENFNIVAELQDSRAELADSGTPLSTSMVNPLEILQSYVEVPVKDVLVPGSTSTVKAGRFTMDIGTRRLVARNTYRNAINAFTGVEWQWRSPDNDRLRVFYTLPLQRRVDGDILDNNPRIDKERDEVKFWGINYQPGALPWGDQGEIFLYGLDEEDSSGQATANREFLTAGFRLFSNPATSRIDYQFEPVVQFGESRASTSATSDLDHIAYFVHAEVGYSFDARWSPRLQFQYDYASGDDDPTDADNNRFDSLFGPGRFDFGPTNTYTSFTRSNISSPGLRLTVNPRSDLDAFVSLRGFWLASDDDIWVAARIGNTPGRSDTFIGTQIETRVRWDILPGNIRLESGLVHLLAGDLMDHADKDNSTFFYGAVIFTF